MSAPRMRGAAVGMLLATALAGAPSTAHAQSPASLRRELAAVTTRIAAAETAAARLEDTSTRALHKLRVIDGQLMSLSHRLAGRLRALYMSGSASEPVVALMSASSPDDAIATAVFTAQATFRDAGALRAAAVLRHALREQETVLRDTRKVMAALQRALQADRTRLERLLRQAAAAAAVGDVLAAAGTGRASRGIGRRVPGTAYACIVGPGHAFTNTFGDPRSGGRRHQGTDVFAPYGSPEYAVTSGEITKAASNRLGGLSLWLRGNDGYDYYYAHNSATFVHRGQQVAVGEQIGTVGNSGDARGGSPHVHFEQHPRRSAAINSYYLVRQIC